MLEPVFGALTGKRRSIDEARGTLLAAAIAEIHALLKQLHPGVAAGMAEQNEVRVQLGNHAKIAGRNQAARKTVLTGQARNVPGGIGIVGSGVGMAADLS